MRLAWLTDIHLNFIRHPDVWWKEVCSNNYDAFVITGDITTGTQVEWTLKLLAEAKRPVYVVLGNHDFYGTSIEDLRKRLAGLSTEPHGQFVKYLNNESVINLTSDVSLVGDDGWYDGRNGRYFQSDVQLNDFNMIKEFKGLKKGDRLTMMQKYTDRSASRLKDLCASACSQAGLKHLYVATHVPPFGGAAWHMGQPSDENYAPFFSNKSVGDAIVEATAEFRKSGRKVTVLCGHTHGEGELFPSINMNVLTGVADYGNPSVCKVFEIE